MTETEAKWAERVQAWRASGLTAREFSTGRDFSAGGLRHWAYRLRQRAAATPASAAARKKKAAPVRVVRVERAAVSAAKTLTVEIGLARLQVPTGVDASSLRLTIAALIEATARTGGR